MGIYNITLGGGHTHTVTSDRSHEIHNLRLVNYSVTCSTKRGFVRIYIPWMTQVNNATSMSEIAEGSALVLGMGGTTISRNSQANYRTSGLIPANYQIRVYNEAGEPTHIESLSLVFETME